jgi:hypothetical protein
LRCMPSPRRAVALLEAFNSIQPVGLRPRWSRDLDEGPPSAMSRVPRRGRRVSAACGRVVSVEIVLRTRTPEGIVVVLPAVVYAKVLEEHAAVADLDLINRTIRMPDARRPDVRPGPRAVLSP